MVPRSAATFCDRKTSFLDSDIGTALFLVAVVDYGVSQTRSLASIFYFVDAINMTIVMVGNRQLGARMSCFALP